MSGSEEEKKDVKQIVDEFNVAAEPEEDPKERMVKASLMRSGRNMKILLDMT
ncbi:hypothetical protein A2U01_0044384 [Trifolium medium]|uniref:Uncharacterized protein n=1 Tax=Trifolium medium TaxID=97028 RepID=A0A392QI35_9FABA|nr:hypothetical protein [Trifolium medium]